tara:strand:+ start:1802 stop:3955 length:2154 start_codon:yes stop_codon:yes gene_type:complete
MNSNKLNFPFSLTPVAALVAGLTLALPGQAQQSDVTGSSLTLEEVVVSARKITESLQDVPSAVSAVSADAMQSMMLTNVMEASKLAPSVMISTDGSQRSTTAIRGVGTTLQTNIQPGVGLFKDGVYVPYTSAFNDQLLDTAQVEIIRGPQGTLFGKNTLGGAINVISKEPSEELSGAIEGRWADDDESYGVSARVSGPLIKDVLLGTLAVSYDESDGFYELIGAPTENNWDEKESTVIKGSLKWMVGEEGVLRINASSGEFEGPNTMLSPVEDNDTDASNSDGSALLSVQPEYNADITRINAIYQTPLTDNTDMSITFGYDNREEDSLYDGDFLPIDIQQRVGEREDDFYQFELRFTTAFSDHVRLMYAAFYSEQETETFLETQLRGPGLSSFGTSDIEDKTTSVYANLFWEFADTWELSLGLRYDEFDQQAKLTDSIVVFDPSNPVTFKLDEDPLSPMVTLKKYWSDDLMLYATANRGVRAGGFNSVAAPAGFETFDGDQVTSYEIGFKSTFADGRATLNMALYVSEQEDIILNTVTTDNVGGVVTVSQNFGTLENTGIEAEFTMALTPAWRIGAGLSYVDSEADDDPTGWFASYNFESNYFLPEWQGNATLSYSAPLGSGNLSSTLGVFYTGEMYGFEAPFMEAPKLDDYTTVNFSADYDINGFSFGVFATNLTDEDYWTAYAGGGVLNSALGIDQALGVKAAPRNVGLRVSYSF